MTNNYDFACTCSDGVPPRVTLASKCLVISMT